MSNDNNNQGEKKEEAPLMAKGMTFDKLKERLGQKIDKSKAKVFEGKFEAKFKELDAAEGIVRNINKELEKMWTEFNEGL